MSGADRYDEVWEGRYVVAPDPHSRHGAVQIELASGCSSRWPAGSALRAVLTFNLGGPEDFRIPDAGLLPGPHGVWHDTAVLVVEVLSPDDATFEKLDFYTAHGVRELLVVDPDQPRSAASRCSTGRPSGTARRSWTRARRSWWPRSTGRTTTVGPAAT